MLENKVISSEVDRITISENCTVRDAVDRLHVGHQRIVLVVGQDGCLRGVVSDSDVRKALLAGLSLERPVKEIMTCNPVLVSPDVSDEQVLNLMRLTHRYELPVVDQNRKVVGLKTLSSLLCQNRSVVCNATEAFVMAGGLGTRLRPLTDEIPKPLLRIGDRPILFLIIEELLKHGISKIHVVINYKAEMIEAAIAGIPAYSNVVTCLHEPKPLGTAGFLSTLRDIPKAPFFLVNADLFTKANFTSMRLLHDSESNDITVALKQYRYQLPYGAVRLDPGGRVVSIDEKPVQSFFINAGIYILNPVLLESMVYGKECTMVDMINSALSRKMRVGSFPIYEYWLDIGEHRSLELANKAILEGSFNELTW